MTRQGLVVVAVLGLALSVATAFATSSPKQKPSSSHPAYTWSQWVKIETPKRKASADRGIPYARPGLPDMSLWKPADFLSQKDIDAPHKAYCSLPKGKRPAFLQAIKALKSASPPAEDSPQVKLLLGYARAGYVNAQNSFSVACGQNKYGLTPDEALSMARKAAASEQPMSESYLAYCLYQKLEEENSPRDFVKRAGSFLVDEMFYWYWRGAKRLDSFSLDQLSLRLDGDLVRYKTDNRYDIELYKWNKLLDISYAKVGTTPTSATLSKGVMKGVGWAETFARTEHMTQAQVIAGRQEAKAWLLKYPEGLAPEKATDPCMKKLEQMKVDYPLLNKYLAALGLRVDPTTHKLEDTGPVLGPSWISSSK